MGALEAGGGVATGALTGMWRSVYRKAAEAAEARLQALLAEHVYHLHGRRAIVFVVDGGGAAVVAGDGPDVELPWAYAVEGWSLYADQPGTAVVDVRAAAFADFPAVASICGGALPTLSFGQKVTSPDVSAWTAALPRGTVLRPVVTLAVAVTRVTLTLHVRAL
jgi:hypothetical protein